MTCSMQICQELLVLRIIRVLVPYGACTAHVQLTRTLVQLTRMEGTLGAGARRIEHLRTRLYALVHAVVHACIHACDTRVQTLV